MVPHLFRLEPRTCNVGGKEHREEQGIEEQAHQAPVAHQQPAHHAAGAHGTFLEHGQHVVVLGYHCERLHESGIFAAGANLEEVFPWQDLTKTRELVLTGSYVSGIAEEVNPNGARFIIYDYCSNEGVLIG